MKSQKTEPDVSRADKELKVNDNERDVLSDHEERKKYMAARDEIKRLQAQIQEEIENVAKTSQVNVTDDNIIVKERESGQSEKDRRESQTDVQDDTVLSNERGILD